MGMTRKLGKLVAVLALTSAGTLLAAENPHWNKSTCATCHDGATPVSGSAALRTATAEDGCESCHDGREAVSCRHASDIAADAESIPVTYRDRLRDGRIVCTTCHDAVYQCEHPNVAYRYQNPGFLHDRISRNTGDQCFVCHDDSGYAKLNPHAETAGDPPQKTCLLCHAGMPDEEKAAQASSFNMHADMNDMCRGCHDVAPHPQGMDFGKPVEGWIHLVRPSPDVITKMEASIAATQVVLPLSPSNGEIYCATCHDPHAYRETPATDAAPEHYLRQDKICQACHDK
jgi:hypothetical protein